VPPAKRPGPPHGWNRYAAPAAFLVAVTVAVLLVRSALHERIAAPASSTRPVATTVASSDAASTATTTTAKKPKPAGSFYTVQAGDTFGTIATKSGTTVAEIERLNPGVASTSLHIGQKIRVG